MHRHITKVHDKKLPVTDGFAAKKALKIKENKNCEICGKRFLKSETLKHHIETVHEVKKSTSEKLDCSLNKYVVSIHERKKQFQYNICDSN